MITSRSKGKKFGCQIFLTTRCSYRNFFPETGLPFINDKTCLNFFIIGQSTIRVDNCDGLKFIEHIQAHVTLGAAKRGDVQIWLISPKGTRSNLIAKRPKDYSRAGFNDWPFLTVSGIVVIFEYRNTYYITNSSMIVSTLSLNYIYRFAIGSYVGRITNRNMDTRSYKWR